jgi:agmatine deiminase
MQSKTPASLGFAMPAEWEKHEATWVAWPHYGPDWPGKIVPIHWVYGEVVRKICPGELVRIIVKSAEHEALARRVLERARADLRQVEFYRWPTNRGWTRDFGPICMRRGDKGEGSLFSEGAAGRCPASLKRGRESFTGAKKTPVPFSAEVAIVKFKFTAWGYKYPNWRLDDQIALRAAKALGLRVFPAVRDGREFALEGGGIEVNGRGTLMTTEECFLDPVTQVRNPGATRADYEAMFRDYLGATNVLWLGHGIVGDDTHGHVDDLCRFVSPHTVILIQEANESDVNYRPLRDNRERIKDMRLEDGSKIQVVELPCPAPLCYDLRRGRGASLRRSASPTKSTRVSETGSDAAEPRLLRLPASYANFYISNAAVIVPTFNDPQDRIALGTLSELFRDRQVVGIHAVDLVLGFGTLHCLTQQQPAR